MKKLVALFVTLLTVNFGAAAQVILYQEDFFAPVTGIFNLKANSWTLENDKPCNLALSSKGDYIRTADNLNGDKSMYISISTLGHSHATITWNQFRNPHNTNNSSRFPLTESVELQYSVNGGVTRTTFYTSRDHANGTWNTANNGAPVALPAAAMGMPQVQIYWKINYNNQSRGDAYYAIDDILISAMPETGLSTFDWSTRPLNENPFVVSGPAATAPYTVDGVAMRWSNTLHSNVTYEIAQVDDKTFKPGTRSLTLVQLGATAKSGSIVQLDLSQPVEDLTFTIFDVDVTAGQFIDKLTIKGYNNGTEVPLTKNNIKTTSYSELAGKPLSFTGLTPNDNASAEGDITVTFPGAVTKVIVEYNNSLAGARTNNGRQGIAIHNLSWRKDQPIMPLPVELLKFNVIHHNGAAKLNWATASELNNDRFEVERSHDGKSFSKIGQVAGKGISSTLSNYSFTDARPATGTNYYRLRQLDYDGTVSFSKTIAMAVAAPKPGNALAKVYPTIATSQVTIAMAVAVQAADVVVLDASGKVVQQYAKVTDTEMVMPVQHLKAGMYFVNVSDGVTRNTYRFIKQ